MTQQAKFNAQGIMLHQNFQEEFSVNEFGDLDSLMYGGEMDILSDDRTTISDSSAGHPSSGTQTTWSHSPSTPINVFALDSTNFGLKPSPANQLVTQASNNMIENPLVSVLQRQEKILQQSLMETSSLRVENESLRNTFLQYQDILGKVQAEREHAMEQLKVYEANVKMVGEHAFSQALNHLGEAFNRAPIPKGIRFAPTDYEVFEYLFMKLCGKQQDVGLDRFLVRRLRGIEDSDGLIPEVELLHFSRPWHLPGLDMAPDGKGQVGYFFVRPEWRPNERRRRREADVAPGDAKPPCWKESCQPTSFEDLVPCYGGKPERRMFRYKAPGAREGPAGEKEKWKMYEYTLKSDQDMFEDRRNGSPVWVICKVMREGPMTFEEQQDGAARAHAQSGGPGGGSGSGNGSPRGSNGNSRGGSGGGGGGGNFPFGDTFGSSGGGSNYGGGGGGGGGAGGHSHGGFSGSPGGSHQFSCQVAAGATAALTSASAPGNASSSSQDRAPAGGQSQTSPSAGSSDSDAQSQESQGSRPAPGAATAHQPGPSFAPASATAALTTVVNAETDSVAGSEGTTSSSSAATAAAAQQKPLLLLPTVSAKPLRSSSEGSGSTHSKLGGPASPQHELLPSWLSALPNPTSAAGRLLEDFFVSKLVAGTRKHAFLEGDLLPPTGTQPLSDKYWLEASLDDEDEDSAKLPPAEQDLDADSEDFLPSDEDEEQEEEEDAAAEMAAAAPGGYPPFGALASLVLGELQAALLRMEAKGATCEIIETLALHLRQVAGIAAAIVSRAALDEPAAQLWLESLREVIRGAEAGLGAALDASAPSRLLWAMGSASRAACANEVVRRLTHTVALLPNVLAKGLPVDSRARLVHLKAALEGVELRPPSVLVSAVNRLNEALADAKKEAEVADAKSPLPPAAPLTAAAEESVGALKEKAWLLLQQQQQQKQAYYDQEAGLEAISTLKAALLALCDSKRALPTIEPTSMVYSNFIQVFQAVGVDFSKAVMEIELAKLAAMEDGKAKDGKEAGVASHQRMRRMGELELEGTAEDSVHLRKGLLALLSACTSIPEEDEDEEQDFVSDPSKEAELEKGGGGGALRSSSKEAALVAAVERFEYHCRVYSKAELEDAVGCQLADGDACGVYTGTMETQGVTVEVLGSRRTVREAAFHNLVERVAPIRHPNVVSLLGCCPDSAALVYEQLPAHSLEDYFARRGGGNGGTGASLEAAQAHAHALPWHSRVRIVAEVASALRFLHTQQPRMLHRDLRPANILLMWDAATLARSGGSQGGPDWWPMCEESLSRRNGTSAGAGAASGASLSLSGGRRFVTKLARVGLAALSPAFKPGKTPVQDVVYLDPEFPRTDELVPASDVYALGVVMVQLLTGRHATGALSTVSQAVEKDELDKVLDPTAGAWPPPEARALASLALKCTDMRRSLRPDLAAIVLPALDKLCSVAEAAEQMAALSVC
eukprot:jgi/Mesen1/8048/ME000043S07432